MSANVLKMSVPRRNERRWVVAEMQRDKVPVEWLRRKERDPTEGSMLGRLLWKQTPNCRAAREEGSKQRWSGKRPGPFLESPGNFSFPKSHSKISNFIITELFYSRILHINRGSLQTRIFRRILLSVLRYRWTKSVLTDPKSFRGFRETGPRCSTLCTPRWIASGRREDLQGRGYTIMDI